jgi:hypothetical protein
VKRKELEAIAALRDEAGRVADTVLDGEIVAKLRALLMEAASKVPYQLSLSITLSAYDDERDRELKLLQTGLCSWCWRRSETASFCRYPAVLAGRSVVSPLASSRRGSSGFPAVAVVGTPQPPNVFWVVQSLTAGHLEARRYRQSAAHPDRRQHLGR